MGGRRKKKEKKEATEAREKVHCGSDQSAIDTLTEHVFRDPLRGNQRTSQNISNLDKRKRKNKLSRKRAPRGIQLGKMEEELDGKSSAGEGRKCKKNN